MYIYIYVWGTWPKIRRMAPEWWGLMSANGNPNKCSAPTIASLSTVLQSCSRKVDVRLPGKLPWREAGPPNHHDDKVDSDQ